MSDSEDEETATRSFTEIQREIEQCKKNPETSGMFVSGWDDADEGVTTVSDPKGLYPN